MSDVWFALTFALVLSVTACRDTQGTGPTVPPQDSTVTVPHGVATLDGTFSAGEWSGAYTAPLTGTGEVRLMHDGGYLYLGVQRQQDLIVTVCVDRGDTVVVLHSSAALGTATYRRAQSGWDLTRGFTWTLRDSTTSAAAQQEREAFLQLEGWVATNAFVGARTDTEFKISMPSGQVRLAVTPMSVGPGYQWTSWWPSWNADACRSTNLLTGTPPARLEFAPAGWVTVIAGQ